MAKLSVGYGNAATQVFSRKLGKVLSPEREVTKKKTFCFWQCRVITKILFEHGRLHEKVRMVSKTIF